MVTATFVVFTAFYMLYPTLALFITEIGGSDADVGLAMGVFMVTSVLFRPIVGGLLDRIGRRPFIVGGLLLFGLAMYLYRFVGGIGGFMVLRALHGLSWALSSTAMLTAVTDMIPPTRRGEGLGWLGMAMTVAMGVGPAFGLWVVDHYSFGVLFLVGVTLTVGALLLTFGAKIPFERSRSAVRFALLETSIVPIMVSVFFLFASYSSINTFLPLFATSIDVNSGPFFLVFAATLGLIRPLAGRISDRRGEAVVIAPGLFAAILAMVTLCVTHGIAGVLIAAVLYGIGFGSVQPVLQAVALRLVGPARRGVANASVSAATDLGIGLGAIALGWVAQATSYRGLYAVAALSVGVSLAAFVVFRRLYRSARSTGA